MIDKSEILKIAKTLRLQPSIIEKDYVLGWVLIGIQNYPEVAEKWIFKGGTCLKKCFFEQYRFSEDLDFTLTDPTQMDRDYLKNVLKEIGKWIYEEAGVELPEKNIAIDRYQNLAGNFSIECKLTYFGPLKQKTNFPKIKLDLTSHEVVVLPPEKRLIFHNYSDRPLDSLPAFAYSYEEIFAEKLRALAERARPRDLYDVVHLYEKRQSMSSKKTFLTALHTKCAFKKIPVPTLNYIARHPQKAILSSEWENMLRHQLSELKPFKYFWDKLYLVFEWIDSK